MTAAARFKQADVARAYKALTGAGMRVGRVEIEISGKIVILSDSVAPPAAGRNPWDEVFNDDES